MAGVCKSRRPKSLARVAVAEAAAAEGSAVLAGAVVVVAAVGAAAEAEAADAGSRPAAHPSTRRARRKPSRLLFFHAYRPQMDLAMMAQTMRLALLPEVRV